MDLILVRHAIAGEHDSRRWPDDSQRPLTSDGLKRFERAASGLRRLVGSVDLVMSSPYVRAWQTARILEENAGWPKPVSCSQLEPDNDPLTIIDFCAQQRAGVIALVGHEPLLGELAGVLLAGEGAAPQPMKKGGSACFSSEHAVVAGGMTLRWWLTPRVLRLLALP